MPHTNIHCRLGYLSLLGLLLPLSACGNETVDLGGGRISQDVQRGARCADSLIVPESVRITSQAQLAELEGCEEIDGDLRIEFIAGADLSPLASLRVVDGLLQIGAYPETPPEGLETEDFDALLAPANQIIADGYLPSLSGLNNLTRVSSLEITSIAAEDLAPLGALRELSGHEGSLPVGMVSLHGSKVHSLHGLENVENIQHLVLSDNLELESLGGIALGPALVNVNLINSPQLTSIAELAPVERAFTLYLSDLGIANLDSLTNLTFVESSISLTGNRNLQNIDRLSQLWTESLVISDNAVLTSIPPLPEMTFFEVFMATGNPELRTIQLELPSQGFDTTASRFLPEEVEVIEIGQNAQLTQVSLSAGLEQARILYIYDNPALASVALGTLTGLESFELSTNPSLTQLDLGALETVGWLSAVDNPALDVSELAAVRTFETTLLGNAAPAPAP